MALQGLGQDYDAVRGGFGAAPKFPPSMVLEFLLRHHERTGNEQALQFAEGTCEAMARGGMYDQLGGGFARYSVDADWVIPHFEKMLYDNALLARAYLHAYQVSGEPLFRRVCEDTLEWAMRELRQDEGAPIRVTLVEPGMVDTPFFDKGAAPGALKPDDVARVVMFAVSQPPHVDVNEILFRPTAQPS